jgi:hypothetical protein
VLLLLVVVVVVLRCGRWWHSCPYKAVSSALRHSPSVRRVFTANDITIFGFFFFGESSVAFAGTFSVQENLV